jgi:hypothetical protein
MKIDMETSDTEEIDEQNIVCIEQHLSSLKNASQIAEQEMINVLNRFKLVEHKLKIELEELSETQLRSKPLLRKWLKARNLPLDCSFQEFFQAFLDEHKKEHRLDLSDRSILLNAEGCKLFGFEGKDKKVSIHDILEHLPVLYH